MTDEDKPPPNTRRLVEETDLYRRYVVFDPDGRVIGEDTEYKDPEGEAPK